MALKRASRTSKNGSGAARKGRFARRTRRNFRHASTIDPSSPVALAGISRRTVDQINEVAPKQTQQAGAIRRQRQLRTCFGSAGTEAPPQYRSSLKMTNDVKIIC